MIEIPLTNGGVTLIDDDDVGKASAYKWLKCKTKTKTRVDYYVVSTTRRPSVWLHRFLMDAQPGQLVDHKDGNGLNNQRSSNLRFCNYAQNSSNNHKISTAASGIVGVRKPKGSKKWIAQIGGGGNGSYLGSFETKEEAALMRKAAEIERWGDFAPQR